MIVSWDVTIPTLSGDEPRRAYVYVPEGWDDIEEQRYPVLYMFDGHNLFNIDRGKLLNSFFIHCGPLI